MMRPGSLLARLNAQLLPPLQPRLLPRRAKQQTALSYGFFWLVVCVACSFQCRRRTKRTLVATGDTDSSERNTSLISYTPDCGRFYRKSAQKVDW